MGQTRTVLVHRLLTEDTVDEAITELLHQKQALFDEYADRSAAGDAQAHSDAAWIARTVAKEQARLACRPPHRNPDDPGPDYTVGLFGCAEFSTSIILKYRKLLIFSSADSKSVKNGKFSLAFRMRCAIIDLKL